jgi:hypothetical protein
VLLDAPEDRRLLDGRRVGGEQLEELAGRALGREGEQPDRAARPADTHELVGGGLVVGSEDHAGRRGHDVELAVAERQRNGVGVDPFDLGGRVAARLELRGLEVRGDDVGARLRRADRHVAGPGRHVEHALAGADAAGLHEGGAEVPDQFPREAGVVAERPSCRHGTTVRALGGRVFTSCGHLRRGAA